MKSIDRTAYGFLIGLLLPLLTAAIYTQLFYGKDLAISEVLNNIFPGPIFGKLLILSIIPDLILIFISYKLDLFKTATGLIISTLPFVILSIIMFN